LSRKHVWATRLGAVTADAACKWLPLRSEMARSPSSPTFPDSRQPASVGEQFDCVWRSVESLHARPVQPKRCFSLQVHAQLGSARSCSTPCRCVAVTSLRPFSCFCSHRPARRAALPSGVPLRPYVRPHRFVRQLNFAIHAGCFARHNVVDEVQPPRSAAPTVPALARAHSSGEEGASAIRPLLAPNSSPHQTELFTVAHA
jgi:hypothetical protein